MQILKVRRISRLPAVGLQSPVQMLHVMYRPPPLLVARIKPQPQMGIEFCGVANHHSQSACIGCVFLSCVNLNRYRKKHSEYYCGRANSHFKDRSDRPISEIWYKMGPIQ